MARDWRLHAPRACSLVGAIARAHPGAARRRSASRHIFLRPADARRRPAPPLGERKNWSTGLGFQRATLVRRGCGAMARDSTHHGPAAWSARSREPILARPVGGQQADPSSFGSLTDADARHPPGGTEELVDGTRL